MTDQFSAALRKLPVGGLISLPNRDRQVDRLPRLWQSASNRTRCSHALTFRREHLSARALGQSQAMNELDESERQKRSRLRAQLMEGMQRGDPRSCTALFDDIGSSLTHFLRRRVADAHELEDVYQEVLVAVFEARHTYEAWRPFEPWLFAIARNIAADYARRRWSRARWEELVADPPDQIANPSNQGDPELETLLARLPSDQREAFSMLKLDGLSVEAASAKAGVSVGALKVRAHRAYRARRRLLGN